MSYSVRQNKTPGGKRIMVSFTPSVIEDEVYNICEQVDYLVSSKEYTKDALHAVEEYFENTSCLDGKEDKIYSLLDFSK